MLRTLTTVLETAAAETLHHSPENWTVNQLDVNDFYGWMKVFKKVWPQEDLLSLKLEEKKPSQSCDDWFTVSCIYMQ